MNLSHPFNGGSVNECIDKETYVDESDMKVRYPTVDNLCDIIRRKSKKGKVKLMKRDLKRAYHQLWMCPKSILWLGFTHRGKIYFDVTLSMGSRSAACCCQRVTNAITYIYPYFAYACKTEGKNGISHLISETA